MLMTACGSNNENKPATQPAAANTQNCPAGQSFNPPTNTCMSITQPQNGGNNPSTPYPGQYPNTQCGAGQVYTSQYGTCLTQAPCPSGFAMYNGSCTSVTQQNSGQYPQYCAPGTYATQVGCLGQGPCSYGSLSYQNQCYYGNYFNYGASFGFHLRFF